MSIRKLLVISDLHCGSTYGLLPPGFVTQEENPVHQNPLQAWAWSNWLDWQGQWWDERIGDDPVALIVNGDATEGVHHGTKEIISPDPSDHRMAARHVLQPLAERCEQVYIVEGTECHTANSEHRLAYDLGAVMPDSRVKAAWDILRLRINGTLCQFQHHIGTTKRVYLEASQLSIELRNAQLEAFTTGQEPPTVLGAAHRHKYGSYKAHSGLCFVTPPWQAVTRFGRKVVPSARFVPGVVLLDFTGKEPGALPELYARTYTPPPDKVIEL